MKTNLTPVQRTVWLVVASSAPILSLAGKTDWFSVGVCALVALLISALLGNAVMPQWIGFLKIATAILFLGAFAGESATCWQDQSAPKTLAVVLLIMSAFAVRRDARQACRIGVSLSWLLLPGLGLLLLAGMRDLQIPELNLGMSQETWITLPIFLLPLIAGCGSAASRRSTILPIATMGTVAVVVTLWLNAASVKNGENAFYEYSKGITLLGIAKRFEAVSACLLTVGWFVLFAYVLAAVREILEEQGRKRGSFFVYAVVGVSVLLLYNLTIPYSLVALLSLISWGLLPVGTQVLGCVRKSRKRDKTA